MAGLLSGVPSTVHALVVGRSPLAAARAAGQLLGRPGLARGGAAHVAVTAGWTAVLTLALPRRHTAGWGAGAGLAIAALDLAVARRRYPAIARLPQAPQVADHAAFGALVGAVLAARRAQRPSRPGR